MTSTDIPATGTAFEAMNDDERRAYWQRGQAGLYAESLRAGLARLERFADDDGDGDTFERVAGDIDSTALWMLAEAQTDRIVYSHADPVWLDLADQIRARAEAEQS